MRSLIMICPYRRPRTRKRHSSRVGSSMTNRYVRLLTLLLQDAAIANFEYWAEFIIRLQRDNAEHHPALAEWFGERRVPPIFCLRLRAEWWIGEREKWMQAVHNFPMKAAPPMPVETALQASTLIMLLHSQVSRVVVRENSDLTLVLSDGRELTVRGSGGEWDECWFLELPVDDIDRDEWSIVCDSEGCIAGKYPGSANA
jgi:hypothetical protein